MSWHWRWQKKKYVPNIAWKHDVPQIRLALEAMPGSKYLECLLYLRLGYTPQVVAEMAKTDVGSVIRHLKAYSKKGVLAEIQRKKKLIPKQKLDVPLLFPSISPRQGANIFLRFLYCPVKYRKPWRMMWLVYIKTVLFPRDHEVVLKEITEEFGFSKADVRVILTAHKEGKLYDSFTGDEKC